MYTLFDFITHIKGMEYIISLIFIAGYILFTESLKLTPFEGLIKGFRKNMEFVPKVGSKNSFKTLSRVIAAPLIGLTYIIAIPFLFVFGFFLTLKGRKSKLTQETKKP